MNTNTSLAGRTAIVTGAGGGIGRGLALALAAAGANVVIAARRAVTGDETLALVRQEGGSAISVQTDVGVRADIERAVAAAVENFGGLDIVVHNASSGQSGTPTKLEEIDDARWDEQYATALDAAFYLAQASFEHLKRGRRGRFIILSSSQALHGGAMNPIYVAVKSAQRGMVKGLAREWGPHGIVVNGIAPASETDTSKAYFEKYPQVKEQILGNIPLRRLGDTRVDIGGAIVALCSDQMQFVTGQVIPVDGGGYTAL
ncbi:SDR family NAD(P)-dependent oxidoreductase [Ramlibacter sp. WS9]|uniref:SDR family NAD(P)-dependent oxidoreductase n=1 Tax=Ramlibacter sp. WS9 TaxID=1882741 RepID=UPI001144E2CE|nr:SDR family oxidoreductase [Ramlibacter sp. WS9]ROZ69157.1 SDR family oxidoreductase [Ramlibacter sp. WS9]